MIQLKILSGKKAGAVWVARRFPVRVGRSPAADLQLDDDGVWDQHLNIQFRAREGFYLATEGEALAQVNHEPVREILLRNGDAIDLGSARLQFWLADTRQSALRLNEALTWLGIALVTAGQVALIYLLTR